MVNRTNMASVLRLATLSYAVACVDASLLFWPGRNVGNWGPAKQTLGLADIDPVGWSPKPTAPPGARPFDLDIDLRKRQQTTTAAATCGFPTDNASAPAISCSAGEYCFANQLAGVAGCCSEPNRRDCRIPTTCIESTRSQSIQFDSRTLVCGDDPSRPRCVTYLYDSGFFENLYGVSFLACGEEAGSSTIATSSFLGWTPPGDITTTSTSQATSEASSTSRDPTIPVTITVFPGSSPSSPTPIVPQDTNSATRTGAIVGGVVGGVAGLALIAAALFFLLRRRKKRELEAKEIEGSPPYAPYPGRDYPAASVYPGGLPEPQYTSDFYGELPPQMGQTSAQHITGYPPPNTYEPVAVPRETQTQTRPTTFVPRSPKPNEDDIVSPITPGDQLNPADDPTSYTWISNPTPPPQSEYSQFSPPPPSHFQSYRPYPGT
ncbi:hypothetical protein F4677DRAFT_415693 [Hypoxylon crocopeplum]|nr:hypothetical protein F4677DRAFT_415693 [Hypoxylon crocopeplum]